MVGISDILWQTRAKVLRSSRAETASTMKKHDKFPASTIKKHDKLRSKKTGNDDDMVYEYKKILAKDFRDGCLHYYLDWKQATYPSWVPESFLTSLRSIPRSIPWQDPIITTFLVLEIPTIMAFKATMPKSCILPKFGSGKIHAVNEFVNNQFIKYIPLDAFYERRYFDFNERKAIYLANFEQSIKPSSLDATHFAIKETCLSDLFTKRKQEFVSEACFPSKVNFTAGNVTIFHSIKFEISRNEIIFAILTEKLKEFRVLMQHPGSRVTKYGHGRMDLCIYSSVSRGGLTFIATGHDIKPADESTFDLQGFSIEMKMDVAESAVNHQSQLLAGMVNVAGHLVETEVGNGIVPTKVTVFGIILPKDNGEVPVYKLSINFALGILEINRSDRLLKFVDAFNTILSEII